MDPLQEDSIHTERHIEIICVGAGASGLCLAYKLQRSFRNYSLTVWKADDLILTDNLSLLRALIFLDL